jgi:hypothetical protein
MDVWYMPRTTRDQVDYLYGEDQLKTYTTAHPIEMYLENISGMEGEQDFVSKFGLEIRDEATLLVSRLRFRYAVNGYSRPLEGDLLYIPLFKNFFEITYVENEREQAMFYTLGRGRGGNVYLYALKIKQFTFSSEIINTGNMEIDSVIRDYYPRTRISLYRGSNDFVRDEVIYQGSNVNYATAQALVYDAVPGQHVDIYLTQGDFVSSANVIGNTSGANWSFTSVDYKDTANNAFDDIVDNSRIQAASDGIINFTEINPFGEP